MQDDHQRATEAIYFRITKIRDGSYWGEATDTYRGFSLIVGVRIDYGQQFTWRREHINEIPMEKWIGQPKLYLKRVRGLRAKVSGRAYMKTG